MMLINPYRYASGGGGGDGFPNYLSATTTTFSSGATDHNVSMPATVASGDLLILQFEGVSDASHTTPSGWTSLSNVAGSFFSMRQSVYYKVAAGTEGGTTVNVVSSVSEKAVAITHRIESGSYQSTPEAAAVNDANSPSTTPNPPNLTPSWGSAKTLWIAIFGSFTSGVSATVSVYPYSDGQTHAAVTDMHGASCWSKTEASSLNPGTFTQSVSGRWVAGTIAIRPV